MPCPTSIGVFGITRTTGKPAKQLVLQASRRHTGGQRDQDLIAIAAEFGLAEIGQDRVDVTGLHRDHQQIGADGGIGHRTGDPDAEPVREHLTAIRVGLHDHQILDGPSGFEQTRDQRFADASATDHSNSGHEP